MEQSEKHVAKPLTKVAAPPSKTKMAMPFGRLYPLVFTGSIGYSDLFGEHKSVNLNNYDSEQRFSLKNYPLIGPKSLAA